MNIDYHKQFRKHFKKRIENNSNLMTRFTQRVDLFLSEPTNPLLDDHSLTGPKKFYRSFSITGDIRVIYKIEGDVIRFYDIGTHNQVY